MCLYSNPLISRSKSISISISRGRVLSLLRFLCAKSPQDTALRVCACACSCACGSCVCNFVSAAETVADMFVLGLGLRLATGMGMGMGLDMRMRLRIRMGLGIGPPAATHPHLLSPLPLALDYSCCLAIRVPVSRLIIIGWRLTIDGNFRAATTARCPVISFYSGLGVGALCSDPMRFDASSSWDSVHAAWSRGLDVIDLFNQWQAK